MKPSFESTVDILVKAYFNGTLEHGYCTRCAVGNICGGRYEWGALFITDSDDNEQEIADEYKLTLFAEREFKFYGRVITREQALEVINASGYTIEELMKIEYAFETADKGELDEYYVYSDDTWMFNGLMAVLDVLADIHGINLTEKEEAKKLFVKLT